MVNQLSAKKTVKEFMTAWKFQEWPLALTYCQITWKNNANQSDTGLINKLKNLVGGGRKNVTALEQLTARLQEHEVSEVGQISIIEPNGVNTGVIRDARIEVVLSDGSKQTIQLRLICEKGPYQPASDGTWGINPNSIKAV